MNFLFLKEKRSIKASFLMIIAIEIVLVGLFMFLPVKTFANDFFITTQFPMQLDKNMSILSGFISNDSNKSAYVWFEYGRNGQFERNSNKSAMKGTRDFNFFIYDLEPGVSYSYRAVARMQDSNSIKYGDTKTFIIGDKSGNYSASNNTTNTTDTSQQTNNASNQSNKTSVSSQQTTSFVVKPVASSGGGVETTNTSVELHGVILTGGVPARGWFEWGATKSLGRVTPAKKLGSESKIEMKETVYGLSPNTTYYYRSVVTTDAGVGKSVVMSFTTKAAGGATAGDKDSSGPSNGSNGLLSKESSNGGNIYVPAKDSSTNSKIDENTTYTVVDSKADSDKDSLKSFLGWGSMLREQFFTVDKEGHINTKIVLSEKEQNKQNFLLAGAIFGKKVLPDTWSEWGFITILLYLIISRLHNFLVIKKKKNKNAKEMEEELQNARDRQIGQNNSGAPA